MPLPFQFQRTQPSPYAFLSTPPTDTSDPNMSAQPPADQYLPTPPVPDLTPNDLYEGNRTIRPKLDPTISDPLEAQKALRTNLELFQPQKSHGLSRLAPVLPAAAAGAQGGGWGALGGLGIGLLMSKLDPTYADRVKKQRELAKTNQTIGTLSQERDANTQEKLRQAQMGNIQSEIENRKIQPLIDAQNAKNDQRQKDIGTLLTMHQRLGHYNPADLNDAGSQALRKRAQELGVEGSLVPYDAKETTAKPPEHLTVGDTVFERGDDGTWKPAEGLPKVAPKASADTSFGNSQIGQSISEAQGEKAKIKDALASTAEFLPDTQDTNGAVVKHPNPVYKDLKDRDRQLDNQVREWRMKLKPETVGPKDTPKLTIEGAIEHFKQIRKRAPNKTEITNMQAALPQ